MDRFRPKLVICENVTGLLKRFLGVQPQIHAVRAAFEKLGYSFQHVAVDTRDCFRPQRCPRVWMWALRDGPQRQADEIKAVIDNLPKRAHMPLHEFLTPAATDQKPVRTDLNARELEVLRTSVETIRQRLQLPAAPAAKGSWHDGQRPQLPAAPAAKGSWHDGDKDFVSVVDLAKSTQRASMCTNASTCVLPNSKLWLVCAGRFLTARECLAVQGMLGERLPSLGCVGAPP